jgi:hypothetical protein
MAVNRGHPGRSPRTFIFMIAFSTGSALKDNQGHRKLNRKHGPDYKEIDP